MLKKIGWMLLFIVILSILVWNVTQWRGISRKISSLEAKIDKVTRTIGFEPGSTVMSGKGYDLTIDMWQIFEKELQDYKQRLREGKQQFDQQHASWNTLLTELKKSLQEYDKFVAAEGEFWEKQLKNYDRLLAKTEERFEILGQVIEELQGTILDLKDWLSGQEIVMKGKEQEEVVPKEEEVAPSRGGQQITPQIKGRGEYKTYPPKEEVEETTGELEGRVIRGTVTGSGKYRTY